MVVLTKNSNEVHQRNARELRELRIALIVNEESSPLLDALRSELLWRDDEQVIDTLSLVAEIVGIREPEEAAECQK